jgi:hypothetical protein
MPQRSPIIFWLLLAATLSIDALVWTWPWPKNLDRPYVLKLQGGLIIGQLSAVCAWSALRIRKPASVQIMPWLAVVVAATGSPMFVGMSPGIWDELTYYGVYVALLLSALWLFERTSLWRRRTGIVSPWRYSVAQLLLAMTLVAVLVANIRNTPQFSDHPLVYGRFVVGYVVVTIASIICWSSQSHWLIRLAGTMGAALAVVFVVAMTRNFPNTNLPSLVDFLAKFTLVLGKDYLIQALVLSVWIGVGGILPVMQPTDSSFGEPQLKSPQS